MPRLWIATFCWLAGCLQLAGVGNLWAQTSRSSETLLPASTQGYFAISNVDVLNKHWDDTQLGHLMADPAMKPFTKDLRRQIEERWSSVHDRLGITLDDMRGVPGGDVGIGVIKPAPGKSALAIVIDVTGKLPQAREMLERVSKRQAERGAQRSEQQLAGLSDVVIQFNLPELEEEKEAGRSTLKGSENQPAPGNADKTAAGGRAEQTLEPRQAFYCLTGNLLVITDSMPIMKGILDRWVGKHQKDSLATHKPFQVVMERCRKDYGDAVPQMRWYIHPLGYAEAARAATPANRRRPGKTVLEVMRRQGVEVVQGAGGFVDFSYEGYELIHRTAVYAPPPYRKAMKMVVLPNATDFTPEPWVPRDIATYTTLYFDILNGFDNFGSLFDELFAEGEEGTWEDVLKGLKMQGPRIDLREELIKHLGQRVSILTDYVTPITTSSERLLFAIEAKDPAAVTAAMKKWFRDDNTVRRQELNGQIIWEMVPDDSPEMTPPDVDMFSPAPSQVKVHTRRLRKGKGDDDDDEQKRLLPHAAITVWQGRLMIASHIEFLQRIVTPEKRPEPLLSDPDFTLVEGELDMFHPPMKCTRFFSRTDEEYRPTYELVRQNKMPESESMLARGLNVLFGPTKKGVSRKQQINGKELPDYQVVRRYLGPAGLQVTSEPDGWFLKGCTLTK